MRQIARSAIIVTFILLSASSASMAEPLETGRGGTLGCIGKHFFRPGEIELTNLAFRNFNSDRTIHITKISVFSDAGAVLTELSPGAGAFAILGPHQSAELNTTELFGSAPPGPASDLFQIVVHWASDGRGSALFGHAARLTRERNELTGALGGVKARGLLRCVTLSLR